MPDQFFLEEVVQFRLGALRLEMYDASDGARGIPKELVLALVSAMLEYSGRGFCGTFNARISNINAGVKVWISFGIV